MTKKVFIAFALAITIAYGVAKFFTRTTQFEWGHHFTFENQLGIVIDSLEISVGDVKTMLHTADSLGDFEGNISVPHTGYPHNVIIKTLVRDECNY